MGERNFILFILLSMMVIMAWSVLFGPKPKPRPSGKEPVPAEGTTVSDTASGRTPGAEEVAVGLGRPEQTTPERAELISGASTPTPPQPVFKTVSVRTEVYEVEFASYGAAPLRWRLLQYPTEKCFSYRINLHWPPLEKEPRCHTEPVEMVGPAFSPPYLPFANQIAVDAVKVPLNTNWEINSSDLILQAGHTVGELVFSTTLPDGRQLEKVYRFRPSRYDVEMEFRLAGERPKQTSVDLALFYEWRPVPKSGVPQWNYNGAYGHNGEATVFLKPNDVLKAGDNGVMEKALEWAGMASDYFLSAVVAEGDSRLAYVVKYMGTPEERTNKKAGKKMVGWVRLASVPPEESGTSTLVKVRLYMGPKDKKILAEVRKSLQFSIDYGSFKPLVMPLIWALVQINRVTHNYGLSIIILTIILRTAMFPLTRRSEMAAKQLKKLQPELEEIRQKYPDDRMKQNEEIQALYRRHKINPLSAMGGCLPVLLQMPIFFAFYKALLISIELRQAPFFGWIVDLSARDPLYIWPVLMGGTQLVMQKITPTQLDPLQQKIFLLMPIIFVYILRDFPAGLLIYWTVSNLVGIGRQIYINRQSEPEKR